MPRNPEKNALLKEGRKKQMLDAALNVYIRCGYHGTDMDAVAEEAHLAKGLLYYYYKTKKDLFSELFIWMLNDSYRLSLSLLENVEGRDPIEQLMYYSYGMFQANQDNPRMMQFNMRMPFDAYAIFGPEKWKEGSKKSDLHRKALAAIIQKGIDQGSIRDTNPSQAANSFWSVFVANVFEYSKLIMGTQSPMKNDVGVFRDAVQFCFQGLGIEYSVWNFYLEKIITENQEGGLFGEGLSKRESRETDS